MSDELGPTDARRLWMAAEMLQAVVYFSPVAIQASKDLGLRGFWMGYFAGRACVMGPVEPAVVTATFFNFHPEMVQRAIPDAWDYAAPDVVLRARLDVIQAELGRMLGDDEATVKSIAQAADLAREFRDGLNTEGRPLGAAWTAVPWTGRDVTDLWLACTALREHRGDGHVTALVAAQVDGCQAHVLAGAAGGSPRETLQPNRGWSDDDWSAAQDALRQRGWLDDTGQITAAGSDAHAAIEARTDQLALPPLQALGQERTHELIGLLEPLAQRVAQARVIPFPNPVGLPDPAGLADPSARP